MLVVSLFLLENQMLRAHAAQLCGYKHPKTGLLTLTAFHDLAGGIWPGPRTRTSRWPR